MEMLFFALNFPDVVMKREIVILTGSAWMALHVIILQIARLKMAHLFHPGWTVAEVKHKVSKYKFKIVEGFINIKYVPSYSVCKCNTMHTENSDTSCDDDGQCNCIDGIAGLQCDRCIYGKWPFPECDSKFMLKKVYSI